MSTVKKTITTQIKMATTEYSKCQRYSVLPGMIGRDFSKTLLSQLGREACQHEIADT